MTTSRVRIAAAGVILLGMAFLGVHLIPIYWRNFKLQRFVDEATQSADARTHPDDALRSKVLERAAILGLPVVADNVQIERWDRGVRIRVKYIVRVDFPIYTVDLHFYPGAGSR